MLFLTMLLHAQGEEKRQLPLAQVFQAYDL
jgi:hypothetical protein